MKNCYEWWPMNGIGDPKSSMRAIENRNAPPPHPGRELMVRCPRVARLAAPPLRRSTRGYIPAPRWGEEPPWSHGPRPAGAMGCSQGWSEGSPTGDPQRNPWRGRRTFPPRRGGGGVRRVAFAIVERFSPFSCFAGEPRAHVDSGGGLLGTAFAAGTRDGGKKERARTSHDLRSARWARRSSSSD